MKPSILLLAVSVAAMTGCNTAYKSGQTPDDVYFSPTPPKDEYVRVEKQDDRRYNDNADYYDDRYLRMKVQNRYRWSMLDDPYYYDNRYSYSYSHWNNPWNQNYLWNYFYNPYCNSCCTSVNPKNGIAFNGGPRKVNLNTFSIKQFSSRNINPKSGSFSYTTPTSSSGSTNTRTSNDNNDKKSNAGNFLRSLFSKEEKSSSSSGSSSNSSSSSSSSSSSTKSSSTSSSSTAPVRRF